MIGTTVSHYKILEKIGEGGMGEVYLAEDTKLKRQVSLKFLSADLTKDEERKQRFIQEARAAAAIQHPHIAAVYDIDESEGRTFIAMEYIPGESLREVIDAKKLSVRRALELGTQIADGLAKAHDRGVVHRDIKPENVLISDDGYAKIIDFGLAKLLEPLVQPEGSEDTATKLRTKEGLVMGTVSYMSPEQARGQTIDARSDIFSFGVLFYEMLSGKAPFRKSNLAESLSAVLNETPAAVSISSAELAPEIERVLRKALAKDPSDRYQSMKDLAIDLRDLRGEFGTSASRPMVAVPAAASKTPWPWIAVGAVALLGVVLGWVLFGRDTAPAGIGASGRPAVAVMYFESLSGDEEIRWLSKGLPNMLVTDLAQTPGLDVVSSQRIHEILTEIGQADLDNIDKSMVPEIAKRAGAGAVVIGSIFKSGDEIRLDVQVQDVGSGRVLSAESVRGNDVFPLVDELAGRIRTSLSLGDHAVRPIADVTTPSLEAFQLYTEGQEALRNYRREDARALYEKAIELDPSFAMAYHALSNVAGLRGEEKLAREYMARTLERIDRLPERQKLIVQADEAAFVQGDTEKAVELLEELLERYPDEEDGYQWLRYIYGRDNQPDKAFETAERAVQALPQSGPIRNSYGYLLLRRGRFPEGLRELESYAELNPDEANPQDSLAEAYLLTGQPEKALEKYARVLEIDPSFGVSHSGRAWAFAILGRYDEALAQRAEHRESGNPYFGEAQLSFLEAFTLSRTGRYRAAQDKLRSGIEVSASQEDRLGESGLELLSALLAIELGDQPRALKQVGRAREAVSQITESGMRRSLSISVDFLEGIAETRRGNLDQARERLAAQSELYDPNDEGEKWLHQTLQGEIALAAGDFAAAEEAFSESEPMFRMWFNNGSPERSVFLNNLTYRDGRARVKKAQGDLPGAIKLYRDLLTTDMSSKWTAMLEPRFVLKLARLLDETGDKEAARTEHKRFLELWKNADEGLPELEESRKYLGT